MGGGEEGGINGNFTQIPKLGEKSYNIDECHQRARTSLDAHALSAAASRCQAHGEVMMLPPNQAETLIALVAVAIESGLVIA
jgi:hypothetical protein